MIVNREKKDAGISQLPRTRTSSVPGRYQTLQTTEGGKVYHLELHQSSAWGRNGW